jgi:Ca2+-binding EF-hand superfamily protein
VVHASALQVLLESHPSITDAEIGALMREMDRDGDGKVGFEEFCRGVQKGCL